MNDDTLMVMALIAFLAYVPISINIRKITGRENKVERGSILKYFWVFLVFGLLLVGVLTGNDWGLTTKGRASLAVLFFVAANLIAHALFGRRVTGAVR